MYFKHHLGKHISFQLKITNIIQIIYNYGIIICSNLIISILHTSMNYSWHIIFEIESKNVFIKVAALFQFFLNYPRDDYSLIYQNKRMLSQLSKCCKDEVKASMPSNYKLSLNLWTSKNNNASWNLAYNLQT